MLVGCYSYGTMKNFFHLFIHISLSLLIFLYYYFLSMVQLSPFLFRQKDALDSLSPSIMSNAVTLPQELYFLHISSVSLFPSLSLLPLSYLGFSLSLVWAVQQPPIFSSCSGLASFRTTLHNITYKI